jgi:hypothetical protein
MNTKTFTDEQIYLIKEIVDTHSRPASEIILDDVDLRVLLKISRRTALNYRNKGLKYFKVENKIFYFLNDIIDFIKNFS